MTDFGRKQSLDGQADDIGVPEALEFWSSLEEVLPDRLTADPMVLGCHLHHYRHRHLHRVHSLQSLLAGLARSRPTMSTSIRPVGHGGSRRYGDRSGFGGLSGHHCACIKDANVTVSSERETASNVRLMKMQENLAHPSLFPLPLSRLHYPIPSCGRHPPPRQPTISNSPCLHRDPRRNCSVECHSIRLFCARSRDQKTTIQIPEYKWFQQFRSTGDGQE